MSLRVDKKIRTFKFFKICLRFLFAWDEYEKYNQLQKNGMVTAVPDKWGKVV